MTFIILTVTQLVIVPHSCCVQFVVEEQQFWYLVVSVIIRLQDQHAQT